VASRCERAFGIELRVRRLFDAPTVAALAEIVAATAPPPGAGARIETLLAQVAELSDEEAMELVAQKLRQRQGAAR
jgi:hypothetical protein